jgi:hypothetical protein
VSAVEIDAYLPALDELKRRKLIRLRETSLETCPKPSKEYRSILQGAGKTIAGFAAFQNHLSY